MRRRRTLQLLDEFGLQERVQQQTHKCRHQLAIFVLRDTSRLLNIDVYPQMLSDHSLIVATVDTRSESVPTLKQQIRRRRWAAFDHAEFERKLCQFSTLPTMSISSSPAITAQYRYNSIYWPISTLWACTVAMHSLFCFVIAYYSRLRIHIAYVFCFTAK